MPLTTALALKPGAFAIPYGSRADVPFGCGSINAQAVFAGVDRANGLPAFAVRIANNTQHAVRAHMRSALRAGAASELTIPPFSIVETLLPAVSSEDRAIVEVRGDNLAFTLDARSPYRRLVARSRVLVAALLVAIAAIAAALAVPAVRELRAAAARPLPTPRVVVRTRVVVHRVVEHPLLNELDVAPSSVVAGGVVRVRYGARAPGHVWLLDERGRVWARRPLDRTGEARFTVPASAAGRTLRVVATAKKGGEHAQMAAVVAVLPNPADVVSTPPAEQAAPHLAVARVRSGAPVRVDFPASHGDALVTITDATGSILDEVDVPAGQMTAVLRAPDVAAPSSFDVVVSVTRGHAQMQTVRALTVLPPATSE